MIEIPEMLTLIEIAVSERGENFHYIDYATTYAEIDEHDCKYVDPLTGRPLCIAGVALKEAGMLDLVREGEIPSAQHGLVGKISRGALYALDSAQNAQDRGETWGQALVEARSRAARYAGDETL